MLSAMAEPTGLWVARILGLALAYARMRNLGEDRRRRAVEALNAAAAGRPDLLARCVSVAICCSETDPPCRHPLRLRRRRWRAPDHQRWGQRAAGDDERLYPCADEPLGRVAVPAEPGHRDPPRAPPRLLAFQSDPRPRYRTSIGLYSKSVLLLDK